MNFRMELRDLPKSKYASMGSHVLKRSPGSGSFSMDRDLTRKTDRLGGGAADA